MYPSLTDTVEMDSAADAENIIEELPEVGAFDETSQDSQAFSQDSQSTVVNCTICPEKQRKIDDLECKVIRLNQKHRRTSMDDLNSSNSSTVSTRSRLQNIILDSSEYSTDTSTTEGETYDALASSHKPGSNK